MSRLSKPRVAWIVCRAMVVLFLAGVSSASAQTIRYVDDSIAAGGDGTSWDTPFKYLQDCLAVAQAGDEIRVGQGTYKPDQDAADPNGTANRNATFQLINGVALKGGYAGIGAPDPDARDPTAYVTILSGDLAGNDLPNFVNYSDNSYHVVTAQSVGSSCLLDGLLIKAGYASQGYPYTYDSDGAGLYINGGSPTITNCTFRLNWTSRFGGGCYNKGSPTLTNCTFVYNKGPEGSALANRASGSTVLDHCSFFNNSSGGTGAGLYCTIRNDGITSLQLENCDLTDNNSDYVAGMYSTSVGTLSLENCTFLRNTTSGGGTLAGALGNASISILSMLNCVFQQNTANSGGAINHTGGGSAVARNCTFAYNTGGAGGGTTYGGAVCLYSGSFNLLGAVSKRLRSIRVSWPE